MLYRTVLISQEDVEDLQERIITIIEKTLDEYEHDHEGKRRAKVKFLKEVIPGEIEAFWGTAVNKADEQADEWRRATDDDIEVILAAAPFDITEVECHVTFPDSPRKHSQQVMQIIELLCNEWACPSEIDGEKYCHFCGTTQTADASNHEKDCPYILAQKFLEQASTRHGADETKPLM